jgi:hypothetical protein
MAWVLLFVLGLFFWIPVLVRARLGASASTRGEAVAASTVLVEAPPAIPPAQLPAHCEPTPALVSRLVLTTTILGKTRRAAIINGRLYREGDKIVAGTELYRLAAVDEDQIDLVGLGRIAGAKRQLHLDLSHESIVEPPAHH